MFNYWKAGTDQAKTEKPALGEPLEVVRLRIVRHGDKDGESPSFTHLRAVKLLRCGCGLYFKALLGNHVGLRLFDSACTRTKVLHCRGLNP